MKTQKMYIKGAPASAPFLKENKTEKQNAKRIEKEIESGKEIKILIAGTFLTRFAGLMFRKPLPPATGLFLAPCNSVHMCFMRFAIDVVYMDKDYKIVKVVKGLKPWLGLSMCSKAWAVLELTAGEADRCGLEAGKKLFLCDK